jgi:hypothetical protein
MFCISGRNHESIFCILAFSGYSLAPDRITMGRGWGISAGPPAHAPIPKIASVRARNLHFSDEKCGRDDRDGNAMMISRKVLGSNFSSI